MRKLAVSFLRNTARANVDRSPWFDAMMATLYLTPLCNLRCSYCHGFGAHRDAELKDGILPLFRR